MILLCESFVTLFAIEGPFSSMFHHVPLQITCLCVIVVALITFERSLPSVFPHVHLQTRRLSATVVAFVAQKRFLPHVRLSNLKFGCRKSHRVYIYGAFPQSESFCVPLVNLTIWLNIHIDHNDEFSLQCAS